MNNKPFKCLHCGRNLGACCPHICKGTLRKRNRIFKHRVTGVIYESKKEEKMIQRYSKCGNRWTNSQTMTSLPHGEYVLYTDHEQAMKTAKLDSARLIVQEEMHENSKCCGNCDRWYSKTTCPHFNEQQRPSDYCSEWKSDQLTRSERNK